MLSAFLQRDYLLFACVYLLYLLYLQVCEELLVSAHEEAESHVWWVDIQVNIQGP